MEEPSPGADNLAKGEKLLQTPPLARAGGLAGSPCSCARGRFTGWGDVRRSLHEQKGCKRSRKSEPGFWLVAELDNRRLIKQAPLGGRNWEFPSGFGEIGWKGPWVACAAALEEGGLDALGDGAGAASSAHRAVVPQPRSAACKPAAEPSGRGRAPGELPASSVPRPYGEPGQCWRPGAAAACRGSQPVPPPSSPLGSTGRGALLGLNVSESGSNLQAANIPFQPQSCREHPCCSCRQPAHVALAAARMLGSESDLDPLLPH